MKTPIYIHEYGVGDCEKNGKIPLYRRAFWGSRKAFQPQTLPHLFKTKQYTWDIIHTPGHAHDHVALYNREKRWRSEERRVGKEGGEGWKTWQHRMEKEETGE